MKKVMNNAAMDVKVLHSAVSVCSRILIDYMARDMGCLPNPVEKLVSIASRYELCIEIDSILVSDIHTHYLLAVGTTNDWYIKHSLVFLG